MAILRQLAALDARQVLGGDLLTWWGLVLAVEAAPAVAILRQPLVR